VEHHEIVIVGAGQSGLSLSAALGEAGREHVVLERGRIGQSWRDRWESFRLVGPNGLIALYGRPYDGPDPHGFLAREEVVTHLERYAAATGAPVREEVAVTRVAPHPEGGFRVETGDGPLEADQVVLASGTYAVPYRPAVVEALAEAVPVTTVQDYRRPDELQDGAVLIIGAGQSACQIAEELHLAGRRVVLACGRAGWAPRRIAGRDCFEWLLETPFPTVTAAQLPSPLGRFFANPQLTGQGGGRDLNYRTLAAQGVGLAGHLAAVDDGTVRFAGDLADSVAWGDARYGDLRTLILARMAELGVPPSGLDDPEPWRAEPLPDLAVADLGAVVLAAGYRPDYAALVPVPEAFDALGFPLQQDGSSTVVPGLHFLGVHYQRTRLSATLLRVGEDAAVLAEHIVGMPAAA
jgi:putative flavoprotein involved in K+ transport